MPVMTAQDYRQRFALRDRVTLPQTQIDVTIRGVDVLGLAMAGKVDAGVVDALMVELRGWHTLTDGARDALIRTRGAELAVVIDALVCAAAVKPRIVSDEPSAESDAIWIDDLFLLDKLAIAHAAAALTAARGRGLPPAGARASVPDEISTPPSGELPQVQAS